MEPKNPKILATYHKITLENGDVKYIKDDNDKNIKYYTKVQNNSKNLENYIIVDKKGNILTKPVTDPEIFTVTDKATNDALSTSGSYWSEYTRVQKEKNPKETPKDPGKKTEETGGKYRGQEESHQTRDYRIPAFERIYKADKAFGLNTNSTYSYFQIPELWRVNYRYLDVDEVNKTVYNDETDTYNWKVDDMFFTTRRSEWID